MQIIDYSTEARSQYGFIAQDQNAPWFNGGGHETWSPSIASAPGGGYFVYDHADGATSYTLSSCTAVSNTATCTTSGSVLPVWPIRTTVIVKGSSVPRCAAPSAEICWVVGRGGTVLCTIDGEQRQAIASPTDADLVSVAASDDLFATVSASDGRQFTPMTADIAGS